ncbi:MAG: hypothetical protein WCG85_02335 [Polyangia bacterium]
MDLKSISRRVAAVAKCAEPRHGRPHRRTTSETRQELDGLLDKIDSLVAAGAPPHPDQTGLAEAQAELDRVLTRIDSQIAAGNSAVG